MLKILFKIAVLIAVASIIGKTIYENFDSQQFHTSYNYKIFSSYQCNNCKNLFGENTQSLKVNDYFLSDQFREQITQDIINSNKFILPQEYNTKEIDQPEQGKIGVIIVSIQNDKNKPAHVFVGHGKTWIQSIHSVQEIILQKVLDQKLSKHDMEFIKINLVGNIENQNIVKKVNTSTEKEYWQLKIKSKNNLYETQDYGLIIKDSVILPIEVNNFGFINTQQGKQQKYEKNQIVYKYINRFLGEYKLGKIQNNNKNSNIMTYQYLSSFIWQRESNKIDNLHRNFILYEKDYQITYEDNEQFFDLSLNYLSSNFKFSEKRFAYQYYANYDYSNNDESYNLLRHAGTIYAMGQMYQNYQKKPQYLDVIKSGLKYMLDHKIPCPKTKVGSLCIYEGKTVKLGAVGLSLLAFSKYTEITKDEQYIELMEGIAKRVMETQLSSGEFIDHSVFVKSGKAKDFVSRYYQGEAMYGLMSLYKFRPKQEYLECVRKGIDFLISLNGSYFDHWLTYAVNSYNQYEMVESHVTFLEKQAKNYLKFADKSLQYGPEFIGVGMNSKPNGSSVGTFVEGYMQTFRVLQRAGKNKELQRQLLTAANQIQQYNNYLQIKPYNALYYPNPKNAVGGVRDTQLDHIVQIDNNQHQMSGHLQYYLIQKQIENGEIDI